jgi:hypothetical protein
MGPWLTWGARSRSWSAEGSLCPGCQRRSGGALQAPPMQTPPCLLALARALSLSL